MKWKRLVTFGMVIDNGINYDSFNSENIYYIALTLNKAYDNGIINQEKLDEHDE